MTFSVDYGLGSAFIEGFMVDSCVITRLKAGVDKESLDVMTGKLLPVTGAIRVIYDGKCLIKKPNTGELPYVIAGQYAHYPVWKILVPYQTDVRFADIFNVTTSRDPTLLGNKMRVVDDGGVGTQGVYRPFWAIDLTVGLRTDD